MAVIPALICKLELNDGWVTAGEIVLASRPFCSGENVCKRLDIHHSAYYFQAERMRGHLKASFRSFLSISR